MPAVPDFVKGTALYAVVAVASSALTAGMYFQSHGDRLTNTEKVVSELKTEMGTLSLSLQALNVSIAKIETRNEELEGLCGSQAEHQTKSSRR